MGHQLRKLVLVERLFCRICRVEEEVVVCGMILCVGGARLRLARTRSEVKSSPSTTSNSPIALNA